LYSGPPWKSPYRWRLSGGPGAGAHTVGDHENEPGTGRQNQKVWQTAVNEKVAPEINRYVVPMSILSHTGTVFHHNIHPLAFFDYEEEKVSASWNP